MYLLNKYLDLFMTDHTFVKILLFSNNYIKYRFGCGRKLILRACHFDRYDGISCLELVNILRD